MPLSPTSWGAGGGPSGDASPVDDLIVSPGFLNLAMGNAAVATGANTCIGGRVIIPRTGTLRDLSVFINTSSGNIVAGILDTTATTRNRLYHTGSIPSPGTGWRTLGDPQLAVTRGDHIDVYVGADNGVFKVPLSVVLADATAYPLPSGFYVSPLGGSPKLAWSVVTYPIGATIAEASLAASNAYVPAIMRIV